MYVVLIPKKLWRKLSPILLIFCTRKFSLGVVIYVNSALNGYMHAFLTQTRACYSSIYILKHIKIVIGL